MISKVHLLLGLSLSGAMNPAVISRRVGASLVRTTPIPRQGSPPCSSVELRPILRQRTRTVSIIPTPYLKVYKGLSPDNGRQAKKYQWCTFSKQIAKYDVSFNPI